MRKKNVIISKPAYKQWSNFCCQDINWSQKLYKKKKKNDTLSTNSKGQICIFRIRSVFLQKLYILEKCYVLSHVSMRCAKGKPPVVCATINNPDRFLFFNKTNRKVKKLLNIIHETKKIKKKKIPDQLMQF